MKKPKPTKPDTGKYVHQRDKIDKDLNIWARPDLTEKQRQLIDLVMDKKTKIVFISGCAGTSKTFIAIYCALLLLNARRISDVTYVRTIIESASKSLGSLPGDVGDKMDPFLMPLMDKLSEFLDEGDIKKLLAEGRIKGIPVNYLRGASLNSQCIILDESQNYNLSEMVTCLTRLGEYSKMLVLGDPKQSDLNGRSGFIDVCRLFDNEESRNEGIYHFKFTKDDIVRSGILKFIVEKLENLESVTKVTKREEISYTSQEIWTPRSQES